jgi:anti-sigma B factor antagonist
MRADPLNIEDLSGPQDGQRILRLTGPIVINNMFQFQSMVRANTSRNLILDMSAVPYVDSAGVGALMGAYVTHQKEGRSLSLVGVNQRIRGTLEVTHVEKFFRYFNSVEEATAN